MDPTCTKQSNPSTSNRNTSNQSTSTQPTSIQSTSTSDPTPSTKKKKRKPRKDQGGDANDDVEFYVPRPVTWTITGWLLLLGLCCFLARPPSITAYYRRAVISRLSSKLGEIASSRRAGEIPHCLHTTCSHVDFSHRISGLGKSVMDWCKRIAIRGLLAAFPAHGIDRKEEDLRTISASVEDPITLSAATLASHLWRVLVAVAALACIKAMFWQAPGFTGVARRIMTLLRSTLVLALFAYGVMVIIVPDGWPTVEDHIGLEDRLANVTTWMASIFVKITVWLQLGTSAVH
ncbi:MAG: hypothetical protein OHK93_003345 [Ramalina farinacea]|uniref:Uncharacterized protein n=1 Tax=Ramalina farinacea TaxID=258253 RepID=A0AA43QT31_9LECA|nr:hypothetical protein [Ramalina farinacea]